MGIISYGITGPALLVMMGNDDVSVDDDIVTEV